jgi:hypothetical protein
MYWYFKTEIFTYDERRVCVFVWAQGNRHKKGMNATYMSTHRIREVEGGELTDLRNEGINTF